MIYAFLLTFIGGLLIGGGVAHQLTSDSYDAAKLREQTRIDGVIATKEAKIDELADALEKAKNAKTVEYKRVTKYIKEYVDRPVYRNECIDDDGLRAVNAIITDKSYNPGKPKAAVRTGNAAGRKDGTRTPGEASGAVPVAK